MGLLEWFGESYNPGSIGSVGVRESGGRDRSRWAVLVCFIVAVLLIAGGAYAIFHFGGALWQQKMLLIGTAFAFYLLLAFFLRPQADMDNIGWLGGLMDHPFRFSDDINRFLLFFQIALFPGRFVAESIVDFFVMLWNFSE
jgi:hypothetical protein